ncbi:hypothetical protein LXL04_019858 [Taraxacum kok-saghyz]
MTTSLRRRRQSEQPWKSTQSAKTSTKNRNIKSENTQKLTTDPSPSAKTSTKPSMITGSKVLCEEWTCEMTNSGAAKVKNGAAKQGEIGVSRNGDKDIWRSVVEVPDQPVATLIKDESTEPLGDDAPQIRLTAFD